MTAPERRALGLQFYIRPRAGTGWDGGAADKLRAMLEAAIQRRHPCGLKLHVHSVDRYGCLEQLTRILRDADLTITRAKVRRRRALGLAQAQPPRGPDRGVRGFAA